MSAISSPLNPEPNPKPNPNPNPNPNSEPEPEPEPEPENSLVEMHDRLPPLSRFNRTFKLDDWQCRVLEMVDAERSGEYEFIFKIHPPINHQPQTHQMPSNFNGRLLSSPQPSCALRPLRVRP